MATVIFSNVGDFRAEVKEVLSKEDDGFDYVCVQTGKRFDSEKRAIRNARSWLKRKRRKYYKKNPRTFQLKGKVKRRSEIQSEKKINPIRTINKLFKMEKSTATILMKYAPSKSLKLHNKYAKKKWDKSVTAVSGSTVDFSVTIATIMKKGSKKERKAVSKLIESFANEPYGKNNTIFY